MRFKGYGDKGAWIPPTKAQRMLIREEVSDYEYIEREEVPDFSHGVVWAHSLGASPSNIFGEMLAAIDQRIEQVKLHKKKRKR